MCCDTIDCLHPVGRATHVRNTISLYTLSNTHIRLVFRLASSVIHHKNSQPCVSTETTNLCLYASFVGFEMPTARTFKEPGTVLEGENNGLNCRIKTTSGEPGRRFTSKELSQLSHRDNAHVAYRGKVGYYSYLHIDHHLAS